MSLPDSVSINEAASQIQDVSVGQAADQSMQAVHSVAGAVGEIPIPMLSRQEMGLLAISGVGVFAARSQLAKFGSSMWREAAIAAVFGFAVVASNKAFKVYGPRFLGAEQVIEVPKVEGASEKDQEVAADLARRVGVAKQMSNVNLRRNRQRVLADRRRFVMPSQAAPASIRGQQAAVENALFAV